MFLLDISPNEEIERTLMVYTWIYLTLYIWLEENKKKKLKLFLNWQIFLSIFENWGCDPCCSLSSIDFPSEQKFQQNKSVISELPLFGD